MIAFLSRLPVIRSILAQPFVTATGLAAFIHSCWTLNTMFNGIEPAGFSWQWVAWVVPGALIAFAIDLGQIVTSAELRSGERTRAKYGTFAIFAIFTYLLQFVYMIQHVPTLVVSAGVRPEWSAFATLIRDACIFLIPALLPIGTVMYTFSYGKPKKSPVSSKQLAEAWDRHQRAFTPSQKQVETKPETPVSNVSGDTKMTVSEATQILVREPSAQDLSIDVLAKKYGGSRSTWHRARYMRNGNGNEREIQP